MEESEDIVPCSLMQNAWQVKYLDGDDVQDGLVEAKPESSPFKPSLAEV